MRAALAYRYDTDPSLYGKPCPTRSDAAKAEMRKLRKRDKRRTQRQAHEVTPDEIERLAAVSAMPRRGESIDDTHTRHAENYATMCTMFDAALRLDDMTRIEWGHLDHRPNDNGDRNLSVPPGKTDEARDAVITPRTYQALMAWRALSPTPDGRISTATSSATLGQRIRRLGQHADIPVTGHSFRRGRATKLAADGASEYDIMSIGGWKSPQMVNTYVNKQAARKVNGRLYPNGHAATGEASESI
ncbi:MAG: tyrosine-type recombinase/integrase, partial [Acidimicrobiaceae bacterium]|nr:tyrosine-type recombinase/integrase [Acidimicrobiaceae bacterium]